MNERQLAAFKATMQSGSVTAAAKRLHVSQPSISRLLSDLERSLGFALFLKSGRGLMPTVEAKEFFASVEAMFLGMDRLEEIAHAIRTTAGSEIRIAAIPSMSSIELPKAVSLAHHDNPEIRFMLHTRNTPAILDAVRTHQLDLGVVGRQPPYDGVEVLFHALAPYVCLMPEDHVLLEEHGPVNLETLAHTESFATFGGAFPDEMVGLDRALSARLKQNSRLSAANVPMTAALVREAGVLAIVDPFSAEQAVRIGGVAYRPIQQKLHYHVALVTAGRNHLSRAATRFANDFSAQLSRRIQEVMV